MALYRPVSDQEPGNYHGKAWDTISVPVSRGLAWTCASCVFLKNMAAGLSVHRKLAENGWSFAAFDGVPEESVTTISLWRFGEFFYYENDNMILNWSVCRQHSTHSQ